MANRTFRAMQYVPFRWFLLGRVAASATIYMRSVAQGWLMYQLSGSALFLGWVSTATSLITLFLAPVGGVVTDRIGRRTILLFTRSVLIVSAFIVAALIFSGQVQAWHLAVAAVVDSMVFAFMQPAQETIYSELVDKDLLLNAVSLDAVIGGLLGMIGATAAGLLIEAVGAGGVYVGMGLLFMLAGYTHIQLPKMGKREGAIPSGSVFTGIVQGVRYLLRRPVLVAVIALGMARILFVMSARTFLPVYAEVDLELTASGLGLLTSFLTAGGLLTSLVTAWLGNTHHKGRLYIVAGLGMGIALLGMALLPSVPFAFIAVFALGGMYSTGVVLQNTVIQAHVDEDYRGRINSLARALGGISPLWMLPAGALTDSYGVPLVYGIQGVLVLMIFIYVGLFQPKVRQLE